VFLTKAARKGGFPFVPMPLLFVLRFLLIGLSSARVFAPLRESVEMPYCHA
jgi:hypothetical protein